MSRWADRVSGKFTLLVTRALRYKLHGTDRRSARPTDPTDPVLRMGAAQRLRYGCRNNWRTTISTTVSNPASTTEHSDPSALSNSTTGPVFTQDHFTSPSHGTVGLGAPVGAHHSADKLDCIDVKYHRRHKRPLGSGHLGHPEADYRRPLPPTAMRSGASARISKSQPSARRCGRG